MSSESKLVGGGGEKDEEAGGVLLSGSCHCGEVTFTVRSMTPYPFNVCHCVTCTKTAGARTRNIMAEAGSLRVTGEEHVAVYRALRAGQDGVRRPSTHRRHFCRHCATYLWAADDTWPQWLWPFATAIDTPPLPAVPPRHQVHIMTDFMSAYDTVPDQVPSGSRFPQYPTHSIEHWHREMGLYGADTLKPIL